MGYLATGYAFAREPDWVRIHREIPAFHVRGYKHKERELWLLDAWNTPIGDAHSPFHAEPIQRRDLHSRPARPVSETVIVFDRICDLLRESGSVYYEPGWLSVPLSISLAARTSAFAFTADDEVFDFATHVDSGTFVRLGCRLEFLDLMLDHGTFRITPYESEEDDEAPAPELLRRLASIPGVRVVKPVKINGGFSIYQHPTDQWPTEWGNCKDLLGFGTFDPFDNFQQAFALTYQANPSSSSLPEQAKPGRATSGPPNDIGAVGAIASCVLWPIGIFLTCRYLLKSQRREALQTALVTAMGLVLMLVLDGIEGVMKRAGALEHVNLAYGAYALVAACAAIAVRAWLKRQPWLSRE